MTSAQPQKEPELADEDLAAAGLGRAEAVAYEQIISRPGATAGELATWWTRPERLPTTIAVLQTKGLVTDDDGTPPRYTAVDPAVALEAPLLDYEDRLQRARERARQLADRHRGRPGTTDVESVAEVVSGRGAVRQQLVQIVRTARQELCWLNKLLGDDALSAIDPDLLRAGVRARTICEPGSVEHAADVSRRWPGAEQVRILPALPMRLCLADHRYAMLPLQTDPSAIEAAVVIHESALLDALVTLFDGLWQRALPLPGPSMPHATAAPHRNSEIDEQRLLTLLLSGLTDTAIARQLGAAHRTVQRHVASLMRDLGAHSRFQIGIQAAIRDRSPNVSRSQTHARTDAYGTDARATGRPRAAVGDVT
jgi:sugar-specific transcriptional regulator TrmB